MIKLYLYNKETLRFFKEDVGRPEYVIDDIPDFLDFTLVPPPDYFNYWYWIDNKWTTEPAS